jgi:hypothetical protein
MTDQEVGEKAVRVLDGLLATCDLYLSPEQKIDFLIALQALIRISIDVALVNLRRH